MTFFVKVLLLYKTMLTINIKKKIESPDSIYNVYISILESTTKLRFTNQERIVLIELLKERGLTENVRETIKGKIKTSVAANIYTRFRTKGILQKDDSINPFFKEISGDEVNFNVTLSCNG